MRLDVRHVSASYGKKLVLDDVSFPEITDGQLVGLLGPNASGKSTLIKCLSGEKGADGHITFDGESVQNVGLRRWFNKVATMPQSPPSPTALTPTELMWSTARALNLPHSDRKLALKIEEIFHELGLNGFELNGLLTLSGGKRQLVGLALALIRDPELLLLDEPTSALDMHWRMIVLRLVQKRIKEEGGVAVAALHDLDLAARYCDCLVLLENGRLIASGSPQDVLTKDNLARVYHVEADIEMSDRGFPRVDVIAPIT